MKQTFVAFITASFLVSAVWFLAVADGTVELVNSWVHEQTATNYLQHEAELLELEEKKQRLKASILEHKIKEKAYHYQLNYMASKGY